MQVVLQAKGPIGFRPGLFLQFTDLAWLLELVADRGGFDLSLVA